MKVTLSGIVIDVKAVHMQKAALPMDSTPSEMVTVFNWLQLQNTSPTMVVTLPGMSIDVKLSQWPKARSLMISTPSEIVTDLK